MNKKIFLISYLVFLVCLCLPIMGNASYNVADEKLSPLMKYTERNFFAEHKEKRNEVKEIDQLANFIPFTNRKEAPTLNGNIVGQAIASNAILLNWQAPTSALEIEKIVVFRTAILDSNGLLTPSTTVELETAGDSTHFLDTDVELDITYEYYIVAVDAEGNESDASNIVQVTPTENADNPSHINRVGAVTATGATLNIVGIADDYLDVVELRILGFYRTASSWESLGVYGASVVTTSIDVELNGSFLHQFVVVPIDGEGVVLGAGELITITTSPPHAPANLAATDITTAEITLNWTNLNDLELIDEPVVHELYRDGERITELSGATMTFTDSDLAVLTSYNYEVITRVGANNMSVPSMINVTTRPHVPVKLAATTIEADRVVLTWENTNNLENITEAVVTEIYRDNFRIGIVDGNIPVFTDGSVEAGIDYTYTVITRVGANNRSEASNKIEVTTLLPAVTSLQVGGRNATSIEVTWKNVIDDSIVEDKEIVHNIYRDSELIDTISGTETIFTDSELDALKTYQYYVVTRAEANDNFSRASSTLEATTRPHEPGNLEATNVTADSVTLEWDNINNTDDIVYLIYRDDEKIAEIYNLNSTLVDTKLAAISSYKYEVIIRVGENESLSSSVNVTTRPHAPQNLNYTSVTFNSVTLEWENINNLANIDETVINTIFRDGLYYDQVAGDVTTFTDNTVVLGKTYMYTVRTLVGTNNESVNSNTVVVKLSSESIVIPPVANLRVADVQANEVEIAWENTVDESVLETKEFVHQVYRNDVQIASYVDGKKNSFRDTNLKPGTEYEYYIITRVISEGIISEASDVLAVTTLVKLEAPTGLKVAGITSSTVKLEWTNPNESVVNVKQDIYRNGMLLKSNIGNVSEYIDTGLSPTTTYNYKVVAKRGSEELASDTISVITLVKLNAPSNLKAIEVTSSSVKLAWTNFNMDVANTLQDIYRNNELVNTVEGNAPEYVDIDLNPTAVYNYKVVVRRGSEQVESTTISVTTLVKLTVPGNLRATEVTSSSVKLEWINFNESVENVRQDIYRNNELVKTVEGNASEYIDTSLSSATTYSYKIIVRRGSEEVESTIILVTTPVKLQAPSNLNVAEVTTSTIKLAWTNVNTDMANILQDIYRNNELIKTVEGNVSEYIDSGLDPAVTYNYKIIVRRWTEEAVSNDLLATTQPRPAQNLKLLRVRFSAVEMEWENIDKFENEVRVINIFRNGVHIAQLRGDITFYSDHSVEMENKYTYSVMISTQTGIESEFSNEITADLLGNSEITPVKNLKAYAVQGGMYGVDLRWANTLDAATLNKVEHYIVRNGQIVGVVPGVTTEHYIEYITGLGDEYYIVTVMKDDESNFSTISNIAKYFNIKDI